MGRARKRWIVCLCVVGVGIVRASFLATAGYTLKPIGLTRGTAERGNPAAALVLLSSGQYNYT